MNTPINNGEAQSDLDMAGHKLLSADLSAYAGDNLTWNSVTGQFDATGGGGTASMTSNEISAAVQVASAAATSADAHANAVSARAVSISAELVSLMASADAALSVRVDGISSPSGSGDVVGPASATDNAIARFDSTTGKLIQNSNIIITDIQPGTDNSTISFGAKYALPALILYEGGAANRYGWGMNAYEMQFFLSSAAHFSWNKGGDFQASGTNELMRLDAATGALAVGGQILGPFGSVSAPGHSFSGATTTGFYALDANAFAAAAGGNAVWALGYSVSRLASGYNLCWGSGDATTAADIGFSRNAAGVVEINNGAAGTYRDLKLRGITLVGGTTIDIIAPASANGYFLRDDGLWQPVAAASDLASLSAALTSQLASTSAALETHINAVSAAGVTGGASVTSQEVSVLVQAASAAATSADAHANAVSIRAVSISNELGSLLASASTALAARDNTISAAAAAADTHANTVSVRAVSISAELASLIASGDAALSTRINTASALAGTADTHANTVSARAVSISNELGSLLASASTALEAHAVAASAAATSAINKAVSDNASLSAVLATSIQTASAAAAAADTHANTVSARAVSISNELGSLLASASLALETHINLVSAAGVTGGASVTSNELASLVQIASLAATSADTHANTVSARAVSISNELGSLLASASTALAARDNTISAAAAAADTHANTVSARAVSISAELASLVQIASLAATSADTHANTISARVVSASAELASLLASTSAAISAQIVSVKNSISLEYMSQINKLSASIQTASTAATNADTHANTVSARAVSISAELASLVQIASLAATSADTHANTVSARAVSISNELGSLFASADAALSLRVTSVAGLAGGGGSVTSTELSTARYIQNTTQTDVDYTASIGDALTLVKMSSASAHNFTVPPNGTVAFPTGTQIIVEQAGTATVTIVAGSGVTLEGGPLTTLGQYSTIVLIKQATNTWLVGNANTAAVSAEVLSIMSAADAALSSRITSVGGAVGGASATSAEVASLVQVASAAAVAADTHANTVSARAVSISAELTSLLASSDTALSLRATSVEAHVNTVSARAVSISAELGSLLASTSAALIAADRSTSIVIKADIASVSAVLATRTASVSAELYSLMQIASQNAQAANYSIVIGDAGKHLFHDNATPHTYVIPANSGVAFAVGTMITIVNNTGAGTITLSITTDTLRRGDGTAGTGARTIPADSVATVIKTKTTEWFVTGKFS